MVSPVRLRFSLRRRVGTAREQLITINQLRSAIAQRMDDVAAVDDVSMFAAALRRPTTRQGEEPR
jgi:hypothetical protein